MKLLSISFFAILLFSLSVSASFEAFSQIKDVGVCQCSSQSDIITVTNTGVYRESFTISKDGSAARYVTTVPDKFELEPGKTKKVYQYFNTPCDFSGSLGLSTIIATDSGDAKQISQSVSANICRNLDALTADYSKTVCPCTPVTFNLFVSNSGFNQETYVIGLNKLVEYASLSENPISLKKGESKTITATVNAPCEVYGKYALDFTITATQSKVIATVPVNLEIEPCYNFDVSFGELVDIDASPVPFKPSTASYEMCNGDRAAIPLKIINNAGVSNLFSIRADGEFAGANSQLYLEPAQEGIALVNLNPDITFVGNSTFTVDVTSARGLITKTYKVDAATIFCNSADIIADSEATACSCISTDIPIKIENKGAKSADFRISIDGPDYVKAKSETIKVPAGNSTNTSINIFPPCTETGDKSITLNVSGAKTDTLDYAEIDLSIAPKETCFPLEIGSANKVIVDYSENIIPISVQNEGAREATYKVSVDKDFASIIDEITLKPGQKEVIALVADFDDGEAEGNYDATVNFSSNDLEYSKTINIELSANKGFFGSLNNFVRYYYYYIVSAVGLILIILIVLFAYWTHRWRSRRKMRELKKQLIAEGKLENKAEKKAPKKEKAGILKRWKKVIIGAAIAVILAALGVLVYFLDFLSPAKEFLIVYWLYIASGIVILALILGVIHYHRKLLSLIKKE